MLSYSKLPEFLSEFNIVKDKIGCKFKKKLKDMVTDGAFSF